jgi:electron transfer flavoprotein alpha subunit
VRIACTERRPQMATMKPGAMATLALDEKRTGEIIPLNYAMSLKMRTENLEMVDEKNTLIKYLNSTEIIVACEWGLSSIGDFNLIE